MLADRVKDDRAAFLELSQIIQPLFKVTQLRVVQPTGSLLAIARDKRHRRATIEQSHYRFDLLLANAQLIRNPPMNGPRHLRTSAKNIARWIATDRALQPYTHLVGYALILQPLPRSRRYLSAARLVTSQFHDLLRCAQTIS